MKNTSGNFLKIIFLCNKTSAQTSHELKNKVAQNRRSLYMDRTCLLSCCFCSSPSFVVLALFYQISLFISLEMKRFTNVPVVPFISEQGQPLFLTDERDKNPLQRQHEQRLERSEASSPLCLLLLVMQSFQQFALTSRVRGRRSRSSRQAPVQPGGLSSHSIMPGVKAFHQSSASSK